MAQRKKKPKHKPASSPGAAEGGGAPAGTEPPRRDAPGPNGAPTPSEEHPYAGLVFVGVIMGLIVLAIVTQLVMD